MGGNEAQSRTTHYGVTVRQLREIMDCRGPEAVEKISTEFGGINGLCAKLHTSPIEGNYLAI